MAQFQRTAPSFFSKTYVHIFFLLVISLSLRLYKFRAGEVFISSDEIFLFEYAVKPAYALFNPSIEMLATQLFRFFNFGWGWGNLFFGTIFFFFYKILGIPFTEVTINLPYVFVGVGSIVMAYFLGREIHSARYGFIVAFLLAILPSHVSFSRSIGLNGISGLFCFLLTLYLFIRYFKTKQEKYKLWGYLSLAYYLFSENQAIAIIPLLFFASYVYSPASPFFSRVSFALKQFFSIKGIFLFILLSLPAIAGAMYLSTKGLFLHSYLNLFHSKPVAFSLYWEYVHSSFVSNIGTLFTILLIIGFFSYIFLLLLKKVPRQSTILLVWLFVYTTPWLFFIVPTSYELRVYNIQTLTSLIFLTGYIIHSLFSLLRTSSSRHVKTLYISLLCLLCLLFIVHTVFTITSAVYRQDSFGIEMPTPVFGFVRENNGAKTLGYYIREYTPEESIIFADVESFNAQYYFNRSVIGDLDLTSEQIYEQLLSFLTSESVSSSLSFDYAFIHRENFPILSPILEQNDFLVIASAVNERGEIVGKLYKKSREEEKPIGDGDFLLLPIQHYDKLFNKKYGNLDALYIDYG